MSNLRGEIAYSTHRYNFVEAYFIGRFYFRFFDGGPSCIKKDLLDLLCYVIGRNNKVMANVRSHFS